MNSLRLLLAATLLLASIDAAAQFSSGSNGSYGPLNVTGTITVDLPPDGVINATTVNIPSGSGVWFRRNALNTPVRLLATGDVSIAGTLSLATTMLSGVSIGGPGGFDGGSSGTSGGASDGYGPGAGKMGTNGTADGAGVAGGGAHATAPDSASALDGPTYGNATLLSLVGGSGGGGCASGYGGGGGGAILIASSTHIDVSGFIQAIGGFGSCGFNHGSGGAVRLVAPSVTGYGMIFVLGGGQPGQQGNRGWVRIDQSAQVVQSGIYISPKGSASYGRLMVTDLTPLPKLEISEVAGTAVAATNPATITLGATAPTAQNVKVRATGFNGVVPFRIVVQPAAGSAASFNGSADMSTGDPAVVTVPVTLPAGTTVKLFVWTR